jgi:ABC-type branched-subunit amino acid transport system permease subunit
MVVILAIATMAPQFMRRLHWMVSFGHSTWFGLGAYVAGLIQLHWFKGQIWLPIILSMALWPLRQPLPEFSSCAGAAFIFRC